MLEKTGIPTENMIKQAFPSEKRMLEGPVAVIECYQSIPCNPCQAVCKYNAIHIGEDINNMPVLDEEKCIGCGLCISKCPGLSIMVVDASKENDAIYIKIPYEFLPLPKIGSVVKGLDRGGNYITDVKVVNVLNPKSYDRTPVITIEADKRFIYILRNIRVEG